jgi:hypothetical protein
MAAGGSYLADAMDAFSDLDLVVAVEPEAVASIMAARRAIAASLGQLVAAFTGEHVGEPRLLICLYDAPPLHVDLKFVALEDVAVRVEDPAVLWERDGRLTRALAHGAAAYPAPDARWIEDRFWVWVHYVATKIGRGEVFEALGSLAFLRERVLGPLGAWRAGARANGVRRIEVAAPDVAARLCETVARYDRADCLRALNACVDLYRVVRPPDVATPADEAAEAVAMAYVAQVEQHLGTGGSA